MVAGVAIASNVILLRVGTPTIPQVGYLIVRLGIKAAFYSGCAVLVLGLYLVIASILSARK